MKKISVGRIVAFSISVIVLIFCIGYIFVNFQWIEILEILKRVDLIWLLAGGSGSIIAYWMLRTLRWTIMLKNLNFDINVLDIYMCSSVLVSFSTITPFQSGEMLKVEVLKRYGLLGRVPGYSSFMIERALDLFVVVLIATISLLTWFDLTASRSYIYCILAIIVLIFSGGIFAVRKLEFPGKVGEFLHHLRVCVSDVKILFFVVLLTFFSWAIVAIGWQVCLYSLSIDLGFRNSMALMSVMTIINVASLIPGAVGISEAGIAEFLIRLGQSAASAQAGALILRVYEILILLLGVIHLFIWKALRVRRDLK
jgi:uncharacterized membrane protein YbhN (UPF0104 family)